MTSEELKTELDLVYMLYGKENVNHFCDDKCFIMEDITQLRINGRYATKLIELKVNATKTYDILYWGVLYDSNSNGYTMYIYKLAKNYHIILVHNNRIIFDIKSSQSYKAFSGNYRGIHMGAYGSYYHTASNFYVNYLLGNKIAIMNYSKKHLDIFNLDTNKFEYPGAKYDITVTNDRLKFSGYDESIRDTRWFEYKILM